MKKLLLLLVPLLVICIPLTSHAITTFGCASSSSCTEAELAAGGSFAVGPSILYNDFTFTTAPNGTFTEENVIGFETDQNYTNNGTMAFKVTIQNPTFIISGFDYGGLFTNLGGWTVSSPGAETTTVYDASMDILYTQTQSYSGGGMTSFGDTATFAPQSSIYVVQQLNAYNGLILPMPSGAIGPIDDAVELSYNKVPEPATMLLLGLGLMGVLGIRRKIQK